MKKSHLGENPDGTPHFGFELEQSDVEAGHDALLLTGPIAGVVSLGDGTSYDVTEAAIPCRSEHVGPLCHHIHRLHNAAGRFLEAPHECSEACGAERIA